MKNKVKASVIIVLILLIFGFCYYYAALPAINIHYPGFWGFIILLSLVPVAITLIHSLYTKKITLSGNKPIKKLFKGNLLLAAFSIISLLLIIVYITGTFLSSEIINAKKYVKFGYFLSSFLIDF